ncbi:PREDICTED: prothymosin alpha [Myotis davidii]|uniref:prothymosin alpha n=1 Tax=Myotis davidii TaxID=225400 RepID=UPI0003EC43A5|nr:PREDICTED: prothymosin alpha [Myotis davidii]
MSDTAVDTSSEITTKDLKEKKEVVEEAENGRDAPANGNANEENGEQEADNEVDEEEEEGGEEEEEEEEVIECGMFTNGRQNSPGPKRFFPASSSHHGALYPDTGNTAAVPIAWQPGFTYATHATHATHTTQTHL